MPRRELFVYLKPIFRLSTGVVLGPFFELRNENIKKQLRRYSAAKESLAI